MQPNNLGFSNNWGFNQTGIPAASGYPQLQGTAFMPPLVKTEMLTRYYASTIFSEISTTEYEGDLREHGTVYFLKEPDPIVRDYEKNGRIIYDTAEIQTVPLTVGRAFQSGIKVDRIDHSMSSMWSRIEKSIIDKVPQAMLRKIDYSIFSELYNEVAPFNRGARAGRGGRTNLGEFGAPIVLDVDNVMEIFWRMSEVLDEAAIPREGRYVVVPPRIFTLIAMSKLGLAYASGDATAMRLTGRIPADLVGMTVITSPYLPVFNDGGRETFYLYAGRKDATAFATIISDAESSDHDPYEFTRFVRVIGAYGFGVLYPEALAAAYVTVA